MITRLCLFLFCLAPASSFAALALSATQDLAFADAAQGDIAAAINPVTDHARGARFAISGGVAGAAYTVNLPGSAIDMTKGGSTIAVNTWTADPSNGTLDGSGAAVFFVGATHAALGVGQSVGSYSGTFNVSVDSSSTNVSASGTATILTIASISLSKVSDLDFGVATRNDTAKTIVAGAAGSASFTVGGEASRGYTITLPNSLTLSTGGGGSADTEIVVNTFTCSPVSPGTLGVGGTQTLSVGATRAAIRGTQTQGNYTGIFTVTVAYQ